MLPLSVPSSSAGEYKGLIRHNDGRSTQTDVGSTTSTPLSSNVGQPSVEDGVEPLPTLVPVIPNCVEFKYYRTPQGFKRLRTKRKVALLLGYIGERYCGLQWNHLPEFPTVEEAVLKALFEADMISLTNISNPKVQQQLNFERASRTDKGVHALCNVMSANLMLPYHPEYVAQEQERMNLLRRENNQDRNEDGPLEKKVVDNVGVGKEQKKELHDTHTPGKPRERSMSNNDPEGDEGLKYSTEEGKRVLRLALPEDIHLYDIVPVTRSFNAYLCCSGRRYEYILPTFALLPSREYSETYFPASVAPSSPNLKEVGFKPGKTLPATRALDVLPDAHGERGEGRMGGRRRNCSERSRAPGRRSKGHFPKSKKRRMQDAEKAKALEQQQNQEEKGTEAQSEWMENTEESLSCSSQRDQEKKTEGSEMLKGEHLSPWPSEEQKEDEKYSEEGLINVDVKNDPEALEAFLTTNRATHFHDHLFESMILFRTIPEETMKQVAKYRISPEQLEKVRSLFHLYEGTHCYHNFTPGGRSTDASCHRYMKSITVSEPILWKPGDALLEESIMRWTPSRFFAPDERLTEACEEALQEIHHASSPCEEKKEEGGEEENKKMRMKLREHLYAIYPDGVEVVRIELDGQSFMLNQIRKMIGAIIGITASGLSPSFLTETLLCKGVHLPIPMVPANGLFLCSLDFSGYENRLVRIQKNGSNGSGKIGINVEALMPLHEVEEQERRTVSVILRNEMGNDLMGKWMRSLRHALRLAWKVEIL